MFILKSNAASCNATNGIEDHPSEGATEGEMGSFSKKPDEAEEKADSVETNTAAVANCGVNKEEEEVQKEAENDVFSGLSNHEDACDDDLSREQRSFARYESPRDAEGREENVAAEEGEKKDEVAKETVTKLPTFDSPISAIT